jgi:alkylation response protein AidB-like acyl-CoA dehydrogenase
MKFYLNDDERMLRDSVDRFVHDSYSFEFRQKNITSDVGHSDAVWQQFAQLGWLGASLPETYGGADLGAGASMVIMEGLGQGLVTEPFLTSSIIAGQLFSRYGSDEQKTELLSDIISGKKKVALAYAEEKSRYSLNNIAVSATVDPSIKLDDDLQAYRINGVKGIVFNANSADKLIVSTRTSGSRREDQGISLFLIDSDASGLSFKNYHTYDGLRASEVLFDNVLASSTALLGTVDNGLSILEETMDWAITALCAEAVGCMSALFDITLEYLKTRKQFGKTIGSFQVLQHRMVDLYMALENSRSLVFSAIHSLNGDSMTRRYEVAAAKIQINDACHLIGSQGVQMHGAIAITDELLAGHYYKRLAAIAATYGNSDYHLGRFVTKY